MFPLPPDDQRLFDRLADGELSADERRALLASLDERTDGWRRCALALLEAQTWRREFRTLTLQETPPTAVQGGEAAMPSQFPARPGRWFALAASTLLAFGLGWGLQARHAVDNGVDSLAADHLAADLAAPRAADLPARELPPLDWPEPDPLPPQNSRDAVTLVVRDAAGRSQRLQLPLVESAALAEQWSPPAVSAQLREGLQHHGLDVRSQRRFAPLFFEQNQQLVPLVIPVDDTYVVPVHRPVY